jgi:hypothetical protein
MLRQAGGLESRGFWPSGDTHSRMVLEGSRAWVGIGVLIGDCGVTEWRQVVSPLPLARARGFAVVQAAARGGRRFRYFRAGRGIGCRRLSSGTRGWAWCRSGRARQFEISSDRQAQPELLGSAVSGTGDGMCHLALDRGELVENSQKNLAIPRFAE